jgi:hypothetical protein
MLQKRQNDRFRRRLIVERLEDRTVLSGNVTALLDPATGLLTITGDWGDNGIAITQGLAGTAIVTGETATTVNGGAAVSFDAVTGIAIQFLDGNDRVDINAISIPGALAITSGIGINVITLNNSTFQQADITLGTEVIGAQGSNIVNISSDVVTGNHLNVSLLNQSGRSGSAGFGQGSVNTVNIYDVAYTPVGGAPFTGVGDLNLVVDDGVPYYDGTQLTGASSVTLAMVDTAGNVNVNVGDHFQSVQLGRGVEHVYDMDPSSLILSVGNDAGTVLATATAAKDETVTVGNVSTYAVPPLPSPSVMVNGSVGNNLVVTIGSNANTTLPTGWPVTVSENVQGNASITVGDGIALSVNQTAVGGSLGIALGNGGVNAFESLTLLGVTAADLFIDLGSNFGDIANVNLTNVAVTDTSVPFAFTMDDEGGSGGMDHVNMVNVQVAGGMAVHFSPSYGGPNVLYAANVTSGWGFIYPGRVDSIFIDGGGNAGWLWFGMPA